MRVLVTGGTGFVGWHVVRGSVDAGHDVVSLSRGIRRHAHPYPIRNVKLDLVRPAGLEETLRGVDAVIHAAGCVREEATQDFERAHVGATANLVDACKKAGVGKLVHISTLGSQSTSPVAYLRTKWEAEKVVEGSGIPFTIFRPALIFGAGDHLVWQLFSMARVSPLLPLRTAGDVVVQPIWVGDVAKALLRALSDDSTDGNIYELGGPAEMTFDTLVEIIKEASGRSSLSVRLPEFLVTPLARLAEMILDHPPVSASQLSLLTSSGTCDPSPAAVTFGLRMRSLVDVLSEYTRRKS